MKEKKYSIAKLGYASVRAESGTQRQLKWHGAAIFRKQNSCTQCLKSCPCVNWTFRLGLNPYCFLEVIPILTVDSQHWPNN